MSLADRRCEPCHGGTPKLGREEQERLLAELPGWTVRDEKLHRTYKLPDFARALELVNRIGAVAEAENHHPDLLLAWGKVEVTLWTHAIGGLSENDFVLAAKVERLAAT